MGGHDPVGSRVCVHMAKAHMIIMIIEMIIIHIGTSWQRVVDMNPQVASGCRDVVSAGQVSGHNSAKENNNINHNNNNNNNNNNNEE